MLLGWQLRRSNTPHASMGSRGLWRGPLGMQRVTLNTTG